MVHHKMGGCYGKCFTNTSKARSNINIFNNQNSTIEFNFLIENKFERERRSTNHRSFFSNFFNKRNRKQQPVFQLVDEILHPSYNKLNESAYLSSTRSCASEDINLNCLDKIAFLTSTTTPTSSSSLDLEWEHETIPLSIIHNVSSTWALLPKNSGETNIFGHNLEAELNSDSQWSRVSSTNSLEWDNVQSLIDTGPPITDIDADTHLLLSEIERLTSKTLRETGQEVFS